MEDKFEEASWKKRKEIEYLRGKNKEIKKQISIMENNIRNLYQKYQKRYGLSKFWKFERK